MTSGFRFRYLIPDMLHIRVLMWLLSGSFATLPGIWHHIWSCHCPWPLISQVCISRDICRHLPASDWSSQCISGLWLADSVIIPISPLYRVNLSSHTRRQLPPVCCVQPGPGTNQGRRRGGGQPIPGQHSAEHITTESTVHITDQW